MKVWKPCPQCGTLTTTGALCETCQQWRRMEQALQAYTEGLAHSPIWREALLNPRNAGEKSDDP